MTVVLISPGGEGGSGGMATVTRLIAHAMRAHHRDMPLKILDPRGEGPFIYSLPKTVGALLNLMRIHRREGVQALHLNVSERASIARKALFLLYGRLFSIPVVVHHHGAEFIAEYDKGSALYRALARWLVRKADCNLVLGRLWRDYMITTLGAPADRIRIMYNAVGDPGLWARPPARRPGKTLKLLTLAHLSPRKGIGELLEAAQRLAGKGHDLELILAGGGEIDRYKRQASDLNIGKICRFPGWLPPAEARELLRQADIFVLPSHHEGLPMAILEALSHSLPVVATPVGSIPEVLTSGKDCLLAPPGDVAALTDALDRLLGDAALRQALGLAARRSFERRFELSGYVERLTGIYAEVARHSLAEA